MRARQAPAAAPESPFKHTCWSAAPPIRQRCSVPDLVTQTIAPQTLHREARRCSEIGYHTPRVWPVSLAVDSHLATITVNCSLLFISPVLSIFSSCACKARPGNGPPGRVTSSQTLKALVEANKEAPSHQHKDTYRESLCACAGQHKNYWQTLSNEPTKRPGSIQPRLFSCYLSFRE